MQTQQTRFNTRKREGYTPLGKGKDCVYNAELKKKRLVPKTSLILFSSKVSIHMLSAHSPPKPGEWVSTVSGPNVKPIPVCLSSTSWGRRSVWPRGLKVQCVLQELLSMAWALLLLLTRSSLPCTSLPRRQMCEVHKCSCHTALWNSRPHILYLIGQA